MKIEFDATTHTYKVDGVIYPSVTRILKSVGIIDDTYYSNASASKGEEIHELTQLIDEKIITLESLKDNPYVGYVQAWVNFINEYQVTFKAIEKLVASTLHHYSGTMDRRADVGLLKLNDAVIDIKSGQLADWHGVQLWGYAIAEGTENMLAVYLRENGTYKPELFEEKREYNRQIWLSALNVYHFRHKGKVA